MQLPLDIRFRDLEPIPALETIIRNSVLDGGYDRLEVGAPVWFSEEASEKGPQASTVHPR